eukprot:GHVR01169297.1.p1 GENE.GHVR01169297.1~~GHVR01169297.1.p1  ORF type:complete len:153 (-),score=30.36 GHVR01169297.1:251-709(-)
MVRKIQVAVDTRDGMLIIARSDARKAEGFEAMLNRLQAYVEAGADIVLPEAVTGPDELQKTIEVLQVPVMANMAHGGATPMMSPQTLSDMGCALSIYPSFASLASLAATETALRALQLNISSGERAPPLYDFAEFGRLIGLDDVADFDRFWA